MEEKLYSYKNHKYKLKPLTLLVLSSAAPMLAAFRKLVHKYTADIDMSEVNKAKERISEIETALMQMDEIGDASGRSELSERLNNAKSDFEDDQGFQSILKLYNECSGLAMLELMGDEKLICKFIENVLCSTDGSNKPVKPESSDSHTAEFVKDVVTDFFGCVAGRQAKRGG